jgi:hypothetical protein
MKTHLFYLALVAALLAIIGSLTVNRLFEKEVFIPGYNTERGYKLRMLASGDLIFERNRFLPLGSYPDYWGDMNVTHVEWINDHQVMILMSDGSQLKITLGKIELQPPNNSVQPTADSGG